MKTAFIRCLLIAGCTLLSLIVGIGGGVLESLAGEHPARAVLDGAAAFGGSMSLLVSILAFVHGDGDARAGRRSARSRRLASALR